MFGIIMFIDGSRIEMERNIGLLDACSRVDVYKKRRQQARFWVVNLSNGDIEYEV